MVSIYDMREDIFEGLKNALSRGESLQSAMQSFHNAGYPLKDIQEAARELQSKMPQYSSKTDSMNIQKESKILQPKNFFPKSPAQKISDYDETQKNPRKAIAGIIIILLIMLFLILVGIFFFRERILEFLDGFFG